MWERTKCNANSNLSVHSKVPVRRQEDGGHGEGSGGQRRVGGIQNSEKENGGLPSGDARREDGKDIKTSSAAERGKCDMWI